jgi:Mg2+/Co2+ transporter CorC
LDQDTVNVMSGAIQYRDKKAEDVMTPIGTAFMLSSADKLTAKVSSLPLSVSSSPLSGRPCLISSALDTAEYLSMARIEMILLVSC